MDKDDGLRQSPGGIPRGLEVLVKKASVDPAFRRLLLERRAAAAGEIGLVLSAPEAAMLAAIPAEQLAAIIAATKVEPGKVPAFLGKAAAVMLVALGTATTGCEMYSWGIRPEPTSRPAATAPATQPTSRPVTEPPSRGIRPDTPATRATQPAGPVADLIKQLDDNDYKVRQAAQDKLTGLLPGNAEIAKLLSDALAAGKLSPEQKLRVENVLSTTRPAEPRRDETRTYLGIQPR